MTKKKKIKTPSRAELFAIEGNEYCANYDAGNVTCVNCCQNREGPYRAGCFKTKTQEDL